LQLDGLLLIDKPQDLTSHDVVARVRKALGQKSVGHTGTLDPLATGLMVMVLGEATKLSDYLIAADKSYRVKVKFGLTTDTLDRTGKVLSEQPCDLSAAEIQRAVAQLQGDFEWKVPVFSAAKVDGKKLYEYGRQGQAVEQPVKTMSFWDPHVFEAGGSHLDVSLSCSKGSFIRSWTSELGSLLGPGAVMEELRRTRVGGWSLEDAVTLDQVRAGADLGKAFIPMSRALPDLKSVVAAPKEMRLMVNGQIPRDMVTRLIPEQKQAIALGQSVFIKVLAPSGELLAILGAEPGQGLKIKRVFRLAA
jgi:tRNA pseudouridine55 synthase